MSMKPIEWTESYRLIKLVEKHQYIDEAQAQLTVSSQYEETKPVP